jgi:hypothetical protein
LPVSGPVLAMLYVHASDREPLRRVVACEPSDTAGKVEVPVNAVMRAGAKEQHAKRTQIGIRCPLKNRSC